MTKKHYEAIAAAIRYAKSLDWTDLDTLDEAVEALAREFEAENGKFSRDKFIAACRIPNEDEIIKSR